jgi:inosine-uridine nucleoside N-ribohydrolase
MRPPKEGVVEQLGVKGLATRVLAVPLVRGGGAQARCLWSRTDSNGCVMVPPHLSCPPRGGAVRCIGRGTGVRPLFGRAAAVLLVLTVLYAGIARPLHLGAQSPAARMILDTDFGPDSDDAGAMAVLHALATLGEVEILATMCNITSPWCAPALAVLNTYYGRADVPVGTLRGPGHSGSTPEWPGETFNKHLAQHYPHDLQDGRVAENATDLYRRTLAQAPDSSVVVVSVGVLTNLRDLLRSQPDTISELSGPQLVSQKVRLLSLMGGRYPESVRPEFNFRADASATRAVVAEWPTKIVFSGAEIGERVKTGPRLNDELPAEHPVRVAYRLWDQEFMPRWVEQYDPCRIYPHNSYDQTAVLLGARGRGEYWNLSPPGRVMVAEDGGNLWQDDPDGQQFYLIERMDPAKVAEVIEELMLMPPPGKRYSQEKR